MIYQLTGNICQTKPVHPASVDCRNPRTPFIIYSCFKSSWIVNLLHSIIWAWRMMGPSWNAPIWWKSVKSTGSNLRLHSFTLRPFTSSWNVLWLIFAHRFNDWWYVCLLNPGPLGRLYSSAALSIQKLTRSLSFFFFFTQMLLHLNSTSPVFWWLKNLECRLTQFGGNGDLPSLCSFQLIVGFVPSLTSNWQLTNCPFVHFNQH